MIALKKITKYPFDNSYLRWVYVEPCVWNRATIPPDESYIFVDKNTKQYLDDNNIVLEWSRFRKHLQTPNIKSVDGVDLPKLRKISKTPIKTLAEIVSGTRGKRRGPKDSFHANDWTENAFNKTAKKHTTDNYVATAIAQTFEQDLIIPQTTELFNLPTAEKRWPEAGNDISWDDMWGDVILTNTDDIPTTHYEIINGNMTEVAEPINSITKVQTNIDKLIPPPPLIPWYQNVALLSFGALLLLLSLSVWMS